jgi:hypothetical protein
VGVILCAKHGRSELAFVCEHISAAIADRARLPESSSVTVEYVADVKLEATFCVACIAEARLTPQVSGDAFEQLSGTSCAPLPVCEHCFRDARERPAD